MSEQELLEIEEREKKSTPGPWDSLEEVNEIHAIDFLENGGDPLHICHNIIRPNDTKFIAHARTDIPKLVAEVRRLKNQLSENITTAIKFIDVHQVCLEENTCLREALEFYADGKHHRYLDQGAVYLDRGQHAREALEWK